MLSLAATLAGTVLAIVGVRLLAALQPANLPRLHEVAVDGRALSPSR